MDDIATVLDDVAILSKVEVKKTAGILGDDLALNAEQVSGVKAERDLKEGLIGIAAGGIVWLAVTLIQSFRKVT